MALCDLINRACSIFYREIILYDTTLHSISGILGLTVGTPIQSLLFQLSVNRGPRVLVLCFAVYIRVCVQHL